MGLVNACQCVSQPATRVGRKARQHAVKVVGVDRSRRFGLVQEDDFRGEEPQGSVMLDDVADRTSTRRVASIYPQVALPVIQQKLDRFAVLIASVELVEWMLNDL